MDRLIVENQKNMAREISEFRKTELANEMEYRQQLWNESLSDYYDAFGLPMVNMMDQWVTGTVKFRDAFKNMLQDMLSNIVRFMAQAAVLKLLQMMLGTTGGPAGWLFGAMQSVNSWSNQGMSDVWKSGGGKTQGMPKINVFIDGRELRSWSAGEDRFDEERGI